MAHGHIHLISASLVVLVLLLGGGGYLLVQNSGSYIEKNALEMQNFCLAFKAQDKKEQYRECQVALDALISGLIDRELVDEKKCIKNPKDSFTAICYLKIWYKNREIQTALPTVMERISAVKEAKQESIKDDKAG